MATAMELSLHGGSNDAQFVRFFRLGVGSISKRRNGFGVWNRLSLSCGFFCSSWFSNCVDYFFSSGAAV
jgi:hypothetical protein